MVILMSGYERDGLSSGSDREGRSLCLSSLTPTAPLGVGRENIPAVPVLADLR